MPPKHLPEVDALRGIAVLAMIVFHVFFILDFQGVLANEMYEGGFLILARFIQFTFLGLVGVSLALAAQRDKKDQFDRGLKVLLIGYMITLVTVLIIPEAFIRFGVLHLIGAGIIFFSLIAHKKYLPLVIGLVILAMTPWITQLTVGRDELDYLWHLIGFQDHRGIVAVDHFPIFPWFAVIAIGVFVGNWLYRGSLRRYSFMDVFDKVKIPSVLTWMGRHSLVIYLVHVPVIWGVVKIFF